MTTAEWGELLNARNGMFRCPAHGDRNASGHISQGKQAGSTVLHCFRGCTTTEIVQSVGLTLRDLYDGPPPTPEQLAVIARERRAKEVRRRQERRATHKAFDRSIRLRRIVDELGAKLARLPDNALGTDELTRLFHVASDRYRVAETLVETLTKRQRPAANGPSRKVVTR